MSKQYLTSPPPTTEMPKGIPYIVGNEAAERFSFYGMRTILVVFMTQYLLRIGSDELHVMNEEQAKFYYHLFVMSAYFFPLLGAVLADAFLGKYPTIMALSLVYCFGHLALAVDESRIGLFLGLSLIAIGSGGIKPCVSAHVGDQFGKLNQGLMSKVFGWFYLSINLGAFISSLLTPILLEEYGPGVAFGTPGVLMVLATIVFWMGRNKFVHVPPSGLRSVKQMITSQEGLSAIGNLSLIYIFVAVFWSLYDQTGSAWVLQAMRMDREIGDYTLLASQIQAINPILILILVPIFTYGIYPAINSVYRLTPLRKIAIGLFVMVAAFAISSLIEAEITGGTVMRGTSHQNGWEEVNVLDQPENERGWISGAKPEFPQELVIRLRERQPWTISSVAINPAVQAGKFLEKQAEEDDQIDPQNVAAIWAKDVVISVSQQPNGEWTQVAKRTLQQKDELQVIEFEPVEAEYVQIQILSNHGGPFVGLKQVQVLAEAETVPAGSHEHAGEVWPDVAAIGSKPHVYWQFLAYLLLTASEVMVSITCLEFSYTQAPKEMKSFIMSLYLLSVSAGNLFTALVNRFIQNADGTSKLEGQSYYWFFTIIMLVAAVAFMGVARIYKGQTYIQGEQGGTPDEA